MTLKTILVCFCSSKTLSGSADKKNKYKTILSGMHYFPADPNADSGHNHIVQYNGKDVAARGVVKK